MLVASARCTYPTFQFDGTTTSTSNGGSSSTGGMSCASVHGAYGCCDANGVLYYCLDGTTVKSEMCDPVLDPCGWDPNAGYYDCNPFPGDPDPNHPIACGP